MSKTCYPLQVSRDLRSACRGEIQRHGCRAGVTRGGHKTVRLAEILLCLEDALRRQQEEEEEQAGNTAVAAIGGECLFEMRDHRK